MNELQSPSQTTHHVVPRSIASTAYDTAWVASLPDPADPRRPRFPAAMEWLIGQQHPDGSWGGAISYQHDRILSTLAALLPLIRFHEYEAAHLALQRAQSYIWRNAHLLRSEVCELVGFELLLPALVRQAAQAGIQLPAYLDVYAAERERKLTLIPPELMYSPAITLIHSLEFLGDDGEPGRMLMAQNSNGSIGNSPAATAYLLHLVENPAAVAYLHDCLASDGGAAVPVLHPCETYDLLWSAYHRFLGGAPAQQLLSPTVCAGLQRGLAENLGISLSPSFPIPDADNTSIALLLLAAHNQPVSFAALDRFERPDCFASFPYERHPSTGVNIHVLDALKWMPPAPEREARMIKILTFLADTRINRTYWVDKWHISPYYATAHALIAFENLDLPAPYDRLVAELAGTAIDWLRYTQNADGSWGFYQRPTSEETAYVLLSASRWQHLGHMPDSSMIQHGMTYLLEQRDAVPPPLWIDKCLYTPTNIVTAVVEAAIRSCKPLWKRSWPGKTRYTYATSANTAG
jgi:halimadienyl-diphosphate synthase